jgi:hypothetical protein
MNLKNHTGLRPFVLSGDQGEEPAFVHGRTFKFFTKDLPTSMGRLATYLIGFLVTVEGDYTKEDNESSPEYLDWYDVAAAMFESVELKNSLLGKPISHNYFKGELFRLFGFVGNGMKSPVPHPPPLFNSSVAQTAVPSWFIPASALLGMKGHHTSQLACLYDGATFEVKTQAAGVYPGLTIANGKLRVTAILNAEPEIRLGPGTQFVRYASTIAASGTKHQIEALGNTSSFQGHEPGAGIAMLAWLSNRRKLGGSFTNAYNLEYVNAPFRGLDQLIHLEGLYADWLGACEFGSPHINWHSACANGVPGDGGPWQETGGLYAPWYYGKTYGLRDAEFVPLISPKRYMETSKMQSVEGSVDVHAKSTASFSGDDVFVSLQYHSWSPATQEEVFKKIISSGVANAVWQTPNLVPSTKIVNKQAAGGINPTKTRYFAQTWAPAETVAAPPSVSK